MPASTSSKRPSQKPADPRERGAQEAAGIGDGAQGYGAAAPESLAPFARGLAALSAEWDALEAAVEGWA